MNLKTAARLLDVHYQTAYRWVRSGELAAVRHRDGYEVSEDALTVFVSRRAVRDRVATADRRTPGRSPAPEPTGPDELVAEVERLIRVGAAVPDLALGRLARGVADLAGVLCVVQELADAREVDLVTKAWWHPDVDKLASWNKVMGLTMRGKRPHLAPYLASGEMYVVDHQEPEAFLARIDPQLHYLIDEVFPHGMLGMPLVGPAGPLGFLFLIIDRPGRVFTADERSLARRFGGLATAAFVRSQTFTAAMHLRRSLHEDISALLAGATDRDRARQEAAAVVAAARGSAFLMAPDGQFLAVSEAFARLAGQSRGSLLGSSATRIALPEDEAIDREVLGRLWRGELDHICVSRTRTTERGPVDVDGHWSVIRWPDLRPAFIIATQSRVVVRPDDWARPAS